jgi:CDP-diacylglycerol---glycerol-3-phosphate 3-phosphatidyltransferase
MSTLKLNLPTILTLSRIVLIPVFVVTVYLHPIFGAFIFSIASLTDFLDGYLARRSGDITKFGIILDPIADKFLVISALVVLVDIERLPAWIAIIIIVREFLVTGLRVVALSKDIVIPAELGGKFKTGFQIASILCLILTGSLLDPTLYGITLFGFTLYDIGIVLVWISLVLSVISGIKYTISFGKRI